MRLKDFLAPAAVAVAATVLAFVQPALVGRAAPGVVALTASIGAAIGVAVAYGPVRRAELTALGGRGVLLAALCGAAGLAAAPLVVMANRHTDAPSAAEVIFLTTAAWAAIAVLASVAARRPAEWPVLIAGTLAALVGSAALIASWEFPSSFSPFVRFPREQAMLLLAGAGWVAFSLAVGLATDAARRAVAWVGAGAALAVATAAALTGAEGGVTAIRVVAGELATYMVASAVLVGAWLRSLRGLGAARTGALLFLPPVGIAVVSWAAAGSIAGGQPMLLGRAAVASAVVVISAGLLLAASPPRRAEAPPRRAILAVGALVLTVAVAGMLADTVTATVVSAASTGESAFKASWVLSGWESAGGWLAVAAAMWLLASATEPTRPLIGGAVLAAAYPVLRAVPLHTWTTWLPARVQQDFGTEYAHLGFVALTAWAQVAAIALALVGLVVVFAYGTMAARRTAPTAEGAGS